MPRLTTFAVAATAGSWRSSPALTTTGAHEPEHIPAELRVLPQWVGWRQEQRGGKSTKVPVNAHTGELASSTDPATWSSFDDALTAVERHGCDGVGFVFSARTPTPASTSTTASTRTTSSSSRGTGDRRGPRHLHGGLALRRGPALHPARQGAARGTQAGRARRPEASRSTRRAASSA